MLGIEIHREFNKKSHELLDAYNTACSHQQKLSGERVVDGTVSKNELSSLKAVWVALGNLLDHMQQVPEIVRLYRLVSNSENAVVSEFREEAASAESKAKKIAIAKSLNRYDVLEQQEDGSWVSIWDR